MRTILLSIALSALLLLSGCGLKDWICDQVFSDCKTKCNNDPAVTDKSQCTPICDNVRAQCIAKL